ncbi:hypothetical protein [Cognatilysobacter bugurensis]|uniref:Lipoprotein n=1 Tax=Cognatilysobacter bugurensis TaxID=543356 RepID=A0A918W944_9GAMM|nr:hypothetical protein [Lysobacter bugurensis]GHA83117.1 hypothetical protein GCM10007067_21540 [Lysobacter bugurensis]
MNPSRSILTVTTALLVGCGYQAEVETLKAQLVTEQIEQFTQKSLSSVRPYITGERELGELKNDPLLNGDLAAGVSAAKAMSRSLVAQLDAVELDPSRPLGACRDALVSTTTLLDAVHESAQAGRPLVALLPQLDEADQHARSCAIASASEGLPIIGLL